MVLRTLVRVAGVAALGAVAVWTTPVGTTPVRAAAAAAVVESGFRRLRLRRRAVAAAVMVAAVMVAAVMVASVMVTAVTVVGNLWIKSRLPQKSVSWPRANTRVGCRAVSVIQSMISPTRPNSVPRRAAGRNLSAWNYTTDP